MLPKKVILLLVLLVPLNFAIAYEIEWKEIYPPVEDANITSMDFVDEDHICVAFNKHVKVGDNEDWICVIQSTSDGGENWHDGTDPHMGSMNDMKFVPADNGFNFAESHVGYLVGQDEINYQALIMKSNDVGQNWAIQDIPPLNGAFSRLAVIDSENAVAVGKDFSHGNQSYLIMYTDNGNNWSLANYTRENGQLTDVDFSDDMYGWACGYLNSWSDRVALLVKTEDGGHSWTKVNLPEFAANISGVEFINQNEGWINGASYDSESFILYTSDGGSSWETEPFPTYNPFIEPKYKTIAADELAYYTTSIESFKYLDYDIVSAIFRINLITDESPKIALGSNGLQAILRRVHGVNNWESFTEINVGYVSREYHKVLNDMKIVSAFKITIYPEYKYKAFKQQSMDVPLIKYAIYDPELLSIERPTISSPEIHINPNPFTKHTLINFSCANTEQVAIKLFDLTGREIVTVLDEIRNAGQHTVTYQPNDLPGGVYQIRITIGEATKTDKLIIFK